MAKTLNFTGRNLVQVQRLTLAVIATLTGGLLLLACSGADRASRPRLQYPTTPQVDHVDTYHGVAVSDPYRWLEDDVRESEQVRQWVDAQNEVTSAYLDTIPERLPIRERLTELWDYEKYSLPEKEGGRYFYEYNDGLQNQFVVFLQQSLETEPELLLDPNSWSEDGTVALASYYPSPDGRYFAYAIQDGGSDWRTVHVLDLDSRKSLDDELAWLKFTRLAWLANGSGFFYSRYPEPEKKDKFQVLATRQTLYFHQIGQDQSEDAVAYARPDHPDWRFRPQVSDDGSYLIITISKGTDSRYQIAYRDLVTPNSEPITLIEGFDYDYSFVGNQGSELFFRTNNSAPKGRLIGIDVTRPEPTAWRGIIPDSDQVLVEVDLVGGHFIAEYLRDARSEVKVYGIDGREVRTVSLPGIGSASGFDGAADDPETFYSYSSFNTPPTLYRYDVASGESSVFKETRVPFTPADYTVEQVFYTSQDGTRIPMFISHRRGIDRDGNQPTLLYGYGGFNISIRPAFSITRLAWMEMGGTYAVANLRGGGEYGEAWHQAGTKLDKQNVFDDFIAAAQYLIAEGYTRPEKLAILGASNGGLLVGAVTNQRPDLFAAALPAVGVMDMLRFHQFTAGRLWVDDYGSVEDPDEFQALYAYSPYHNITVATAYPAILATTADTDDRVVPSHSFKYMAALQKAQSGDAPTLIRIETRAGHGAGKPTDKTIQEYADQWAFLVENLGMELPADYGSGQSH